jgi:hypothetical protein
VEPDKHQFVRTVHHERITSPLVTTEIEALINSWRRDLRARNLARKTIKTYGESADQLVAQLAGAGVTDAQAVTREHVSDFITEERLRVDPRPSGTGGGPGGAGDGGEDAWWRSVQLTKAASGRSKHPARGGDDDSAHSVVIMTERAWVGGRHGGPLG